MAIVACALLGACSFFGSHPLQADASLGAVAGSGVHGEVSFSERGDAIQVAYNIAGLVPGSLNSLVIHAGGNCGGTNAGHAGPSVRQADLGVADGRSLSAPDANRLSRVWADDNGVAVGFFVLRGLSLDGVRSVVGRTVILHQGADQWQDDSSDPKSADAARQLRASARNRYTALACGVIQR